MKQIRQGDVMLEAIQTPPAELHPIPADQGRTVLAYGEATGHAHALDADTATQYEVPTTGERYLHVVARGPLRHEEHTHPTVPPGWYRVRRQRVYTPERIRNVAD